MFAQEIHKLNEFSFSRRHVQQPWHAESTAADLRKPSADAEHAFCSLHAQYDAVTGSKSRVGLPGKE